MADMRDFPSEPVIGSTFQPVNQDFGSERINLEDEGLEDSDIRPLDDSGDLGAFHTVEPEETSNTGKFVGALAVALIIGGAGVFAFSAAMKNSASQPAIAAATAPKVAATTPPPAPLDQATITPDATPAPAQDNVTAAQASAPVTRTPMRSARTHEATITQPSVAAQPSPAVGQSTVPEAVSPPVPSSTYAANAAGQATPADPGTAQDMPQSAPQDNTQAQNQTQNQTQNQASVQSAPDQTQSATPAQPVPQTPDSTQQPAQPQQ